VPCETKRNSKFPAESVRSVIPLSKTISALLRPRWAVELSANGLWEATVVTIPRMTAGKCGLARPPVWGWPNPNGPTSETLKPVPLPPPGPVWWKKSVLAWTATTGESRRTTVTCVSISRERTALLTEDSRPCENSMSVFLPNPRWYSNVWSTLVPVLTPPPVAALLVAW
jgi:hypothetical protein